MEQRRSADVISVEAIPSLDDETDELSNDPSQPRLSVHDVIARNHDALIRFLRQRLNVSDDAHDVAQETYIRMLRYGDLSTVKSPVALLFRVALNVLTDFHRSRRSRERRHTCNLSEAQLISETSAEREATAAQTLELLTQAVMRLTPRCREIFVQSRVSCMTNAELASHHGLSIKAVEKHIRYARAECLKLLSSPD